MTTTLYRRDTCRFCGGRNLELVFQLASTPVGSEYVTTEYLQNIQEVYPVDVFLCKECGYAGLLDVVPPEDLFTDSTEVTSMSLGVIDNLKELADFVVERVKPQADSLIVDIGSNDGTLLTNFKQRGLRVLGVEPAHYAAHKSTERGIPTLSTFFTDELAHQIRKEHGPAKVVTATRVFANIDDLTDTVNGIRHLLDEDGVFVFETGYLVDIVEKMLFETIYHEHLGYDSVKPLVVLFRVHGMEFIDVSRIPIKGGSIRGIAQIAGGPRPVSESIAKLVEFEESIGADHRQFFEGFTQTLNQAKTQLGTLLERCQVEGKTVAGYGASVGSTTMIYHFGLGDKVNFLVDDNPRNQGHFSPGHHIPVYAPQALYDQKPDYVIILAWRYADTIIKSNQAYLDQGGHFLVPLPELQVI